MAQNDAFMLYQTPCERQIKLEKAVINANQAGIVLPAGGGPAI